ncbi:MAG: TonB-dependent receptor [Proteobacteria bacterium]|nr:TonB-dependent receptor [Pseudomonadota bacterium]
MRKFDLLGATALALLAATPALAQTADAAPADEGLGDIVVTAQRQSETLQTVPIAVSAFSADNLRQQQINSTSDLQLSLPNITYTKSNFTSSSSFNIRGIGDLCVGVTCDAATAVHVNDVPVIGSPIFQNEFFDVERIEVLRGPQGTLFGRNATGGVINFITAKPDLNGIHAAGEVEYGNYKSIRAKGMFNLPITETLGVRVAGYYLNRDGFTRNLFNGKRIDGRDQYDIRGSIRWEPTADTTLDIVGHYFRESDDRSRIQKQLCHRDPTGVLGCLPDKLATEQLNGDSTLAAILTSSEFINVALGALAPVFRPLALGSVYNTDGDVYSSFTNPAGLRTVNIDSLPRFKTNEKQILVNLSQNLGDSFNLKLDGGYTEGATDSTVDYNVGVERPLAGNTGLATLAAYAALPDAAFGPGGAFGAAGLGGVNPFKPIAAALIPSGPGGPFCQSLADQQGVGVYGGKSVCASTSLDFDRSTAYGKQWFAEGILTTKWDGPFNFLVGAGYLDYKVRDNDYFVNAFPLDYAAGLLGAASSIGARAAGATIPNVYRGTPFYDNDSRFYHLKSYGIFGEAYAQLADNLKLTIGARYNHDKKNYTARTTLFNDSNGNGVLVPFGATDFTQAINYSTIDFDALVPGNQEFARSQVSFGRLTGRAVLDWQITDHNLLYFSYSRGYKSGGINPPLSPVFAVPATFGPETVNAFEIGSKNTFLDGTARINLTAFYYQYKSLQLSRIVARTSVNDNVNADIMGLEAEGILRPTRNLLINTSISFLRTRVSNNKLLSNPQDPSGERADAVIIKDLTNAANCAVGSASGSAAQSNALVSATNALLGLRPTTPIPGTSTTGAFGVCGILQAAAAGNIAAANPAFAAPNPALGGLTPQQFINLQVTGNPATPGSFQYFANGVPVNIKGNNLPQSPHFKFSAGMQYTFDFGNGWNLVPRIDMNYTGGYYGSIFNRRVSRIQGYEVVNAQIQLNGPDDRFFVRAFVQNLTKNNAVTGLYVTDQSSGLFTNAFTLEPRRYGIAAGFRF